MDIGRVTYNKNRLYKIELYSKEAYLWIGCKHQRTPDSPSESPQTTIQHHDFTILTFIDHY